MVPARRPRADGRRPARALVGPRRVRRPQRPRRPVAYRHELGYVPEEPFLYPFLSGREYLELIGHLREIPEPLLAMKIDGFLGPVRAARGGGSGDRLLFEGHAAEDRHLLGAHARPAVLLFDEPESGSTSPPRWCCATWCGRWPPRQAIIYSSHILEVVERVCAEGHRPSQRQRGRRRLGRAAADAAVAHVIGGRVLAAGHQGGPRPHRG